MAFNAGSLVATFRLSLDGLQADKARAVQAMKDAGAAADAAGKKADAVGTQAQSGARKTATAAAQAAAAQKGVGDAAAAAGAKATAAAGETAAAEKAVGDAAAAAGRKVVASGDEQLAAHKRVLIAATSQRRSFEDLGHTVTGFGVAAAAGFGVAIAAQVQFGAKQAQLRALSRGDASSQAQLNAQIQQAGVAALTYGQKFGQGVGEVQDAEIELQKAGIGIQQQLGGALTGALTLAAAGQENVADATETAVAAMTQFNLQASAVPHLADLLAAGADKALGSVGDLSMALKQGGLVAAQMGLSIDDTVGTLSAFAQAGLIGSDAGTSLKQMLLSLQSPSRQAKQYMDQLGISAYDANGNFVGIVNLAGQLHDKLQMQSQATRDAALSTIFGSDAIRSANVLYNLGAKGIQGWITQVNDSGFAAQQAAGKMDSLEGDSTKLAAAWQSGLVRAGQDLAPMLRLVVQGATGVVTAFGSLDPVTGSIAIGLTGLVGLLGLLGGGFLLLIPKIAEVHIAAAALAKEDIPLLSSGLRNASGALTKFRTVASGAADFMGGPWGIALLAAAAALTAYNAAAEAAKSSTGTLEAAAGRGAAGLNALIAAAEKGQNATRGPLSFLDDLNGNADSQALDGLIEKLNRISQWAGKDDGRTLQQRYIGNAADLQVTLKTLDTLGTTLATVAQTNAPAAAQAFDALTKKYQLNAAAAAQVLEGMGPYRAALVASATAAGVLNGHETQAQQSTKLLAFAHKEASGTARDAAASEAAATQQIQEMAGAAATSAEKVKGLDDALKGLGSTQLDANAAEREFQQAVADAATAATKSRGAVLDNGRAFDLTSQKGRDASEALDGIARAAAANAAALQDNGASQKQVTAAVTAGRAALIKAAEQLGLSRSAARKYADALHLIPGDVTTLFVAAGIDETQQKIAAIKAAMNNLNGTQADVYINARLAGVSDSKAAQIAKNAGFALGGAVRGGTYNRDTVDATLAGGEHVLTAPEVTRMGGQSAVYAFRADVMSGRAGYKKGGAVSNTPDARLSRDQAALDRANATLKRQQAAADRAQKAYEKAADASAKITGKGTAAKKHAAAQHARTLERAAQKARADVAATQKQVTSLGGKVDTDTTLVQGSQDLAVSLGRGDLTDPSNPYSAVDSARSLARSGDLTKAQSKTLQRVVNSQEKALEGLAGKAKAASDAIDADNTSLSNAQSAAQDADSAFQNMQQTFTQLAGQVAGAVAQFFDLGSTVTDAASSVTSIAHNAGTAAEWDEKVTTTTPAGTTGDAIRSAARQAASSEEGFASLLQQLVQKGYSTQVVQSVAMQGVEKGTAIAQALLTATGDEVADLNSSYARQQSASNAAGNTVAQQAYGDQLAAAQATANAADQQVVLAQQQLDQDKANAASINTQIVAAQNAIVLAMQQAFGVKKANGGIVERFAGGGIRPGAHIVAAGANRVLYGEPETGGEAYIPFAPSKRVRSLQVLNETARRLGMMVTPGYAMADGGILGGASGATTYGGDQYNLSGMWLGSPQQVARALRSDAQREKLRKNRAAGIGRVQP